MFLLLPTPPLVLALQSHSAYMCPFVLFAGTQTHSLLIDCRKSNPTASSASLANQLLMGSDVSPPRGASSSGPGGSASSPLTAGGAPEIPKSPPKWPLRPGVLAYVKGDTKQNICAARNGGSVTTNMNHSTTTTTTTANESALNKSAVSAASGNNANGDNSNKQPQGTETTATDGGSGAGNGIDSTVVAPGDRVLRKALKTIVLSEDVAIQVEGDDDDEDEEDDDYERRARGEDEEETNMNELINFTNSNFINRILKRLRWRRQGSGGGRRGSGSGSGGAGGLGFDNRRSSPSDAAAAKKTKKCRRRLLLLRKLPKNGLFGSWKSTNSHTELFDSTRHRPAGIKYPSSGNWLCFVYPSSLLKFIYSHAHSQSIIITIKGWEVACKQQ